MMGEANEELSWERLESTLTNEKRMKLLDFIFYHGPINGDLSVIDVDILAKGVMNIINGLKQPENAREQTTQPMMTILLNCLLMLTMKV